MATQIKQAASAAQLPDTQTAYDNVFRGVWSRVFFSKLAAAGHVPQTEKQAAWMVELAGKIRTVRENEQVKQAEEAQDPYFLANQALDATLSRYGLDGGIKRASAAEQQHALHDVAAHFMQDPVIYNSVLSLKAAEAEELEAQHRRYMAEQGR